MIKTLVDIFKLISLTKLQKSYPIIFLIIILTILAKICATISPFFYGKIIDILTLKHSSVNSLPILLILGYGFTRFLSFCFDQFKEIILSRFIHPILRSILLRSLHNIHQLSHNFHLSKNNGSLPHNIRLGLKGIEEIITSISFSFIPIILEIALAMIFVFNFLGTIFLLQLTSLITIYLASAIFLTNKRLKNLRKINVADSKINRFLVDNFQKFELIKYFNRSKYETRNFNKLYKAQERLIERSLLELVTFKILQRTIMCILLTVCFYYAHIQLLKGTITIGQLVMLMTYLIQLFEPVEILSYEQDNIRRYFVHVETFIKILRYRPKIKDHKGAKPLKVAQGEINFEKVNFGYKKGHLIFNNISFLVPARKTVALVGISGAGKTTVTRLLLRFYEINSGKITIDGQNIREVTQESLRSEIGIVPQDTLLFNSSIYDNIAYANPKASQQEVHYAAKLACLDQFIMKLPKNYDTIVGERGLKISGGERQRIALARVLLKRPKILVFDEATSSLDPYTESLIENNLNSLKHKFTIIIITHHLSTIANADKILLLKKGGILEEGTHLELLNTNGIYSSLWKKSNRYDKITKQQKRINLI